MNMTVDQQVDLFKQRHQDSVVEIEKDQAGCPIVWVKKQAVIDVLRHLKDHEGLEFKFLADLTCYDDHGTDDEAKGRFVMVYQLYSPQYKTRLRIKARVAENESIATAVPLWAAANWAEREVYDLYGVKFQGHPDLRRILMDYRWQGHPLRKDYYWRDGQIFNDPEQIPMDLLKD